MELCACMIFLFLFASPACGSVIKTAVFSRKELCNVETRLSSKCMAKVSNSESLTRCCIRCNLNSSCFGASLEANTSSCYLHSKCNTVTTCTKENTDFLYFEKQSETTTEKPLPCSVGTWNATTKSCMCYFPYAGELCQRLVYSCTELFSNYPTYYGYITSVIMPPIYKKEINAVCYRDKSVRHTYVLRSTGEMNWNKTWTDYSVGFFTPTPPYNLSFWVGLKALVAFMGPDPRNVVLNIAFYTGASVKSIAHRYTGVVIGDNSTNYLLTYAAHTSLTNRSEGNCLEFSNMTTFSTWDANHDGDSSENWALRAGGGWWFPAFNFSCNPVGSFYNRNTTPATGDGYVRLSGVSTDDSNYLQKIEMYFEEDYV